jgi:outer membrane receptor for ferrienterochelin and colicin
VSNGFQAEVFVKIKKRVEIKTGYNFLDVYRMTDGEKQLLPFNSRHKVVAVLGYTPLSERWRFDMNAHWYGTQRLPSTASNPREYRRGDFSKPYTLFNAQFSYDIKKFELYAGCENVFNFRQNRPILSWENPFGEYFDTSSVWGPTRGREIYVGVRYRVE